MTKHKGCDWTNFSGPIGWQVTHKLDQGPMNVAFIAYGLATTTS